MRTIIGTLLSIILISFYSFAEQLGIPDLGEGRMQFAQTAIDSKDREIGIKRYSDPSVFPMIGWRGMIIETDDRDSTYYVQISTDPTILQNSPEFEPINDFLDNLRNNTRRHRRGGPSSFLFGNFNDYHFGKYSMDFTISDASNGGSLVQRFDNGTKAKKHYAFIPSRVGTLSSDTYHSKIQTTLHQVGNLIYYRWWRQKTDNSQKIGGDIHQFVNPREISIALFGDSFGSGEGAPSVGSSDRPWIKKEDNYWSGRVPSGWIYDNPSHRSLNSGFELALKKWIHTNPDFAINFGNYSWSGAIAYLPPINHNGRYNHESIQETAYFGPKTMWGQLTQLNELGPNNQNQGKIIDSLFINMGGNDAGFSDIIMSYLSGNINLEWGLGELLIADIDFDGNFDITNQQVKGKMFNNGQGSWIDRFDRSISIWSEFFNDNFNGNNQHDIVNEFLHVEGSTDKLKNIHEIAWFNYPDVTAGSPDRISNLIIQDDEVGFNPSEWAQVKPLVIDVLNQQMHASLRWENSKITLFEHPQYETGGLGIPYNYIDDIKYIDEETGEITSVEPKGFHAPAEYSRRRIPLDTPLIDLVPDIYFDTETTHPNRWYNHLFLYKQNMEPNISKSYMGSFHPNENGYRNAYLPLYERAFDEKISFAKLRQRASEEGLPTYHDLVGEPISISASKDQGTGNFNITGNFKINNLSNFGIYSEGFNIRVNLKSDKMEYRNGRPLKVENTQNIGGVSITFLPEDGLRLPIDLSNQKNFSFTVDHNVSVFDIRLRFSEFHSFLSYFTNSISPFGAFVTDHIPQRYTVEGYVDSQNDIFEGIGENNNYFKIGDVYPDPAYDPKVQQSLRDQSRQFEIELRGLVKEAGGNLPDSTVEELDPEWLENLINRAFGEAQIKDRMEELTGFRKPDGKIENRAFEDEMVIPISEMYRMADFAKALSDREKGIEILSSMKGSIPLINEDLAFDEIQFSHVKNQEVHGIANFADALAECRYLMDEMEFTYFKYSQDEDGIPEYTAYQMKLDTGGLFRGIRAEFDNKDNLVIFIDPNELPDEIAKGPIQVNLAFDDPGQFISCIEREGIIDKTTIVILKEDWLGDQVQDGRGILVDVSILMKKSYNGIQISTLKSLAGYRVLTKSNFPSVELPLIKDFGEPDPVNVFRWQSPKEGINPDWTHAKLRIKSGSKILLEEIAEYSDQKISFEKMYQNLAGYGVNLTVDFELGNKDFSISSGVKSYPFHYTYKVPLIKPVLSWNPPQEWSEGLALTSKIQNANASYDGKELEGNFEYSFKAGDQLRSGNQVLQATFIPNSPEYATSVVSRLINVKPSLSLVVKEDPFRFEFGSIVDQEYQIEVSEDLQKWTILKTFSADSVTTTYEPEINGKQRVQFYRVTTK